MTKCKRKLLPAEPYEIDALESWFSDLSAEGLHVQKANALYATFTEGEKKRLLFRMEPKQDAIFPALDESKAEERNAQHKEKGWNFVCGLNRFYVYAAEEGTADYFATPEEEGAYYPDNLKGNKFFNSIYAELLVIVVLIAAYLFVLHRQTTYDWVNGSTNPFCNLAFLLIAIFSGQRIRGAIKLQSSLAAGEPHHQPTDWQTARLRRKHRFHYVCIIGMITFLLLPLLPNVFSFSDRPIAEVKQPTCMDGLEVIPANINLTGAEIELIGNDRREYILQEALAEVKDAYDFIIIDCPPSLNMITVNALVAANTVLVPIQCEYFALEGLEQLLHTVNLVKKRLNPELEIEGIVFTMYDARTNLSLQVVEEVKRSLGQSVYRTIIPRNVRLGESPSHGLPINLYDPKSKGAEAYALLAEEVMEKEWN